MARHNELGKWGEDLACETLITKGYAIMERNVRLGHNEIDIVAMKGNKVVFVEVKTRSSFAEDALDAIDDKKMRHLCNAAESYVQSHKLPHEPQMDVIIVEGSPETGAKIEHLEDAFMPPLRCR